MKIGLTGTMSVGKTTLVEALKESDKFTFYKFATERSKYLNDLGIPLNTDSTLKGQTIFLAERCSELLQNNIITDRTVIDVMSFAQCSKSMNYLDKDKFEQFAACLIHEYDHIFYVLPLGVDIEDNGVRETDAKFRKDIDNTIQHYLSKYGYRIKNTTLISGSTEERIERVKQAIFPSYL